MAEVANDPTADTGLRRRNVGPGTPSSNANTEDTVSSPGNHSPSNAQNRRKGFVELLFSPLSFVLGDGEPEDPQTSTRTFVHGLRRRYGEHLPHFEHTSFRDAVSTARTASKFLLVFLHSSIHDDADTFCRRALCTPEMSQYLNESDCIVSWAGCVQQAEGFGVSLSLGCATFPFLALLTCASRGVNVVERITGVLPPSQIIRQLDQAVDRHSHILATARHMQRQRTESQLLREEQDREYQESLAADRRRAEEQRQKEAEEAERKRQEEEERVRREEEEKRKEEERLESIERKRQVVANGPKERKAPEGADYKVATLKFHLHNGTKLQHYFYAHDTLQAVRDFIDVEFHDRDIAIANYELATNFPKRVFGPEQTDMTLEEAGLSPQALVFVQDLDS